MLAVAVAEGSLLAYHTPLAYSTQSVHVAHPVAYPHHVAAYSTHVPAYAHHVPAYAYAHHAHAAPIAYAHHAPAVVAHAPVAHAATYTAANRGSVHTAPLPGHTVNQQSLNLSPAPGTL